MCKTKLAAGDLLKMIRLAGQESAAIVGERSGIRVATIFDIENGKTNFKIDTLISVANALDMDVEINFVAKKGK